MKRFSSLSALASISVSVGLSLTTASVAFAAPPPANDSSAKPTLVAQAKQEKPGTRTVQPTDPAPTEGGGTAPAAPADPAASPAEPAAAEPGTTPAITIGTGAPPGADAPATAATDPAKKPAPRPWAGTNVAIYNSVSTATIFKGQQQDYNPTVDSSALVPAALLDQRVVPAPRPPHLQLRVHELGRDADQERASLQRHDDPALLPEDSGAAGRHQAERRPQRGRSRRRPSRAPARWSSRRARRCSSSRAFEHVLGGEVAIISSFTYSHPFYRSTTPEVRTPPPYTRQCVGGGGCQDQLTGTMNPSDSMLYALILTGEWGKWAPGLAYFGTSSWAYSPKEVANRRRNPGVVAR